MLDETKKDIVKTLVEGHKEAMACYDDLIVGKGKMSSHNYYFEAATFTGTLSLTSTKVNVCSSFSAARRAQARP